MGLPARKIDIPVIQRKKAVAVSQYDPTRTTHLRRRNIPMHASGIYQIQSNIDGKIYIGSTIDLRRRKKEHLKDLQHNTHGSIYLQRYANKYGIENLSFSILEFCPKNKLIEREQYYIDTMCPTFNMCLVAGSSLGRECSEKTRKKMSETRIGKNNPFYGKHHSEETKEKIRAINLGYRHTEEAKQRMREANIGRHHSEETKKKISMNHADVNMKGENNPMYGKHHSEEAKRKMSVAKKGKYLGKNHPMYGRHHSEESKRKISITKQKQRNSLK